MPFDSGLHDWVLCYPTHARKTRMNGAPGFICQARGLKLGSHCHSSGISDSSWPQPLRPVGNPGSRFIDGSIVSMGPSAPCSSIG